MKAPMKSTGPAFRQARLESRGAPAVAGTTSPTSSSGPGGIGHGPGKHAGPGKMTGQGGQAPGAAYGSLKACSQSPEANFGPGPGGIGESGTGAPFHGP